MNGNEKPYRFQIESKGVYGFAGLYDESKDPDVQDNKSIQELLSPFPSETCCLIQFLLQ